jgi:hydrogenase-4 component F
MTILLLLAPIGLPLVAAGLYTAAGWHRRTTAWAGLLAMALVGVDAITLAVTVTGHGPLQTGGGLIRADALSAWMLLGVAAVALLACWASPAYLAAGHESRRRSRWYGLLLHLFIAAMATAVLAGNLGVLWVAIEATTIVTAFLVGHHRDRPALEAAWKYVVICSAAIAVAFLGLVLLYYAARHAGLSGEDALDWATLAGHAHHLDPAVTRIAVGLAVIGFGAKAGLVPLHAWLPDAHSQAPAPVSALMSGVLLPAALYAVLRVKAIADSALGAGYLRSLLLILALSTLALAALLLIGQRDYKRMLAYSSMEHMGLIALAAAIGTRLAVAALLLHMAGHGLAKTVAFLSSGHILRRHDSSQIADVRALATRMPLLAGLFGLAVLALLGLPPAALFASELGIARAGAAAGLTWVTAAGFALVVAAFAAITVHTGRMLLGPGLVAATVTTATSDPPPAFTVTAALPLIAGLLGVAALGITLGPVAGLLHAAASIVAAPRPTTPRPPARCPAGNPPATTASPSPPPTPPSPSTPTPCNGTASGWPWSPPTTTATRYAPYTCTSPPTPTGGWNCTWPSTGTGQSCPAWPGCRSPPAASSARCTTCTASSRSTTRCCAGWSGTGTGRRAGTRCATTPARHRSSVTPTGHSPS